MYRITEVVKQLLILNGLLYLVTHWMMPQLGPALAMYYPASDFFRPWQIVTHMFMHANFQHLFFNMFALFMFGTALESYLGPKKFLILYLLSGFGALALYLLVWYFEVSGYSPAEYQLFLSRPYSMVGASGAVFGLLAGYGMLFPESQIMLLIPPIPIKAKYFVVIYAALELYFGISQTNPGVAHFAHVGGAIFGALIILYWRKSGFR
ncbi:MAG: rhomboid family intramembrane serine protease [Saprospiraceae bacterium]|nr:rhomboid family intramembrane serine protease [Saprospiraceae bacterium]